MLPLVLLQGSILDAELELLLEEELKLLDELELLLSELLVDELELLLREVLGIELVCGVGEGTELLLPPPPQAVKNANRLLSKTKCFIINCPLSIEVMLLMFRIVFLMLIDRFLRRKRADFNQI
jgi:hypothetical protein